MNIPHLAKSCDPDNTRTRYCRAFQRVQCGSQRFREGGGRPFISLRFAGLYFFTTFSRTRVKNVSLSLSLSLSHQGHQALTRDSRRCNLLSSCRVSTYAQATKISSYKKEARGKMYSSVGGIFYERNFKRASTNGK